MTPDNSFSTVRSDPTRLGDLARYFITYFPLEWFTAAARLKGAQDCSNLCIATLAQLDYKPGPEFQRFLGYGAGNSTLANPRGATRLILEASVDVIDDIVLKLVAPLHGSLFQDEVRTYMAESKYGKVKEGALQRKALEDLPAVLEKLANADRIKEAAEKVERDRQEKISRERAEKWQREENERVAAADRALGSWNPAMISSLKTDPALLKKLKGYDKVVDAWKNTGVIIPDNIDEEIKFEDIEVDDTGLTKATAGAAKLKKQQDEQALAKKVAAAKRELEKVVAAAAEKERLRVADLPSELVEGSETGAAGSW